MSEQAAWHWLRDRLPQTYEVHFERIENGLSEGTPDLNFCLGGSEGWLELKHIHGWPVRSATTVRITFTPAQRRWLDRRAMAGGNIWLLLRVERTCWVLLTGSRAAQVLGLVDAPTLLAHAVAVWADRGPEWIPDMLKHLQKGSPNYAT